MKGGDKLKCPACKSEATTRDFMINAVDGNPDQVEVALFCESCEKEHFSRINMHDLILAP